MAVLPDKEKLLRNFYVAPTGKKNTSTLLSLASVCLNYVTKTEARKIAFRAARVRCGL